MALIDSLFDIAPEFITDDYDATDRINRFITRAKTYVSESVFGAMYEEAVIYLAAHLLTISKRKGLSGNIVSESVGSISRNYSKKSNPDDDYDTTSYGVQYKIIRDSFVVKTPIIG